MGKHKIKLISKDNRYREYRFLYGGDRHETSIIELYKDGCGKWFWDTTEFEFNVDLETSKIIESLLRGLNSNG